DRLHMAEVRGELVLSSLEGRPFINKLTGDVITPVHAQEQITHIEQALLIRGKQIKRVQETVLKLYRSRNWLLLCGFLGLFISKVLVAYSHCSNFEGSCLIMSELDELAFAINRLV